MSSKGKKDKEFKGFQEPGMDRVFTAGDQDGPGEAQAQLDAVLSAMEEGGEVAPSKVAFVPESPVNLPTPESIQAERLSSARHAAALGNAQITGAQTAQIAELQDALGHKERVSTAPSVFAIGSSAVTMPKEAKDYANNLYVVKGRDGRPQYVREKADKLLDALFGSELSVRVHMAAARHGFDQKPLVWVSQALWFHVETDVKHEWRGTHKFSEELDRSPNSPFIRAMGTCCYPLTVRNVARIAAENDISVIDVLACIFNDICDELKVVAPTGKEVAPAV